MAFPVQNIRDAAKLKGLTLAQIEKKLGIGNGVIAKWEKTKSAPPYDRIVAIADFLNVPVSQLTGEEAKFNIQIFAEERKNPALENENGITDIQKLAIDFIKTLSDKQLERYINMGKAAFGEMDN